MAESEPEISSKLRFDPNEERFGEEDLGQIGGGWRGVMRRNLLYLGSHVLTDLEEFMKEKIKERQKQNEPNPHQGD